jgi:hypothetical protein
MKPSPPDPPAIIHVSTMGNMANQMIQHMVALALQARVPGAVLSNVRLPLWGIEHPYLTGDFPRTEIVTSAAVPLDRLAAALRERTLERVDIRTYGQRLENFLPADAYRCVFRHSDIAMDGAGPGELLCNIRQGDILDGHHPDYVLIPPDFYADLAAETGLSPVFMGQLEDSPYTDALRARFPAARFLASLGPLADFERIRRARFIVPSISTFGWLAAWLSQADQVFLPVLGLLHPLQSPSTQLLPFGDARYRFYLFPHHYAVPVERAAAQHAALRGLWRYLPHEALAQLLRPTEAARDQALCLSLFEEDFYRAAYRDIDVAVAAGHLPSGRHHYEHHGHAEGRDPFFIDKSWYCAAYPIAAVELGAGGFADIYHHWLTIGRARGYRRRP